MSIVVTGATGHFGRLVVQALLERGTPANEIVATGRDRAKLSALADLGVQVRHADFDDVDSLREAFADAERLLLVSGTDMGQRPRQHRNAIDAAKEVGVELLVYTSIANADRTGMLLAADHQATEKALAETGVPYALLRNSWYLEIYAGQLPTYLEHQAVLGSADNGRVSAATRTDYAEAAAVVLLGDDQAGKIYELGGDAAFTLEELAETISTTTGRPVTYRDLPVDAYTDVLVDAGLPQPYAEILADSDLGIARGDLLVTTGDLSRLLGRPTTSLAEAIQAAVDGLDG
jgi:NAD(P)H dehydrogenase (quinone)